MMQSDITITFFLVLIMLNIFLPIIIIKVNAFHIISIIIGIIGITFSIFILNNPNITYIVYSTPIYLSNGTLLYSGQWVEYTTTIPYHPMIELFLFLPSVLNVMLTGLSLRR